MCDLLHRSTEQLLRIEAVANVSTDNELLNDSIFIVYIA